jgi:hypothetical protein
MQKLKFSIHGIETIKNFFKKKDCEKLYKTAIKKINFNDLFKSEKNFQKIKKFKDVNPRIGKNLIEKMNTEFIFLDKKFMKLMSKVLGNSWKVLDYKFVCGVPEKIIPSWVKKKMKGEFVPNLGPYIREKYQNVTYFMGIDYHQDIIDFAERESDFITAYIYINDVDRNSSPIKIIPKSHTIGASVFPHKIKVKNNEYLEVFNDNNKKILTKPIEIVGKTGQLSFWHCSTMHGTKPMNSDKPRLSVRILIEKNKKEIGNCIIDKVNKNINGKLSLNQTRRDLTKKGNSIIKGNFLNKN